MKRLGLLTLIAAVSAVAYIRTPIDGPPTYRTDSASMQFLVNTNITAGLMTSDSKVWITADSAPAQAIQAAFATWNGVSTSAARFAPLLSTSLSYNSADGNHVITFTDDAFTRSLASGILAATGSTFYTDGRIFDTDIVFSPMYQFSTNGAVGTYDLQAVLTHELGHAMGANHTNILSATMYYSTPQQDRHAQVLGADDIAFVSTVYPPPGGNGYGTITGFATVSGTPVLGGAITAIDPDTGITIGGLTSVNDGSYAVQVPPGNYFVFVEPATGTNLYLSNSATVISSAFQAAFLGGNNQPSLVQVQAGGQASADLSAAAGSTPLRIPLTAVGGAGLTGDYHGVFTTGLINVSSGQSVDVLFGNPLSGTITESNIQILGPATLRPGSLRRDTTGNLSNGSAVYRFTLDVPALTANRAATLVFKSGSDIITRSGLLNLTRPQAVNAGSFLGGPVAPGEILSFFGSQLGPASPASNGGFDGSGKLPSTLGGITVTFDQNPAPLFYVSNSQINLQVPYEISGQDFSFMTVSYNGAPVAQSTLPVAKSAPGIFVVTNADGSANGANSPSPAGGVLVIYGTGSGVTSVRAQTGAPSPDNSTIATAVTIGGVPVTPIFAGLTPGSVGLTQVNVAIPDGTPSGTAIPLRFIVNGVATQTVNIAVR